MDNYIVTHLHSSDSNPYSGWEVDSITPFETYIKKAKECGMKAIAFTEHGAVLHNIAKRQMCEKLGIKYINAAEFYVTENIDQDNMVRDNYHCCLYAKNYDGVLELNKLSSDSFNRDDGHFYYNPRITLDELINTSDNILISTACVGGILCKGTNAAKEKFLKFIIDNKERCWLEIQPHDFDLQVQYNKYLYAISQKYGLKLIATNDIHAIDRDQLDGRRIMQKAKEKKVKENNSEPNIENSLDLSWKTYDEMVRLFRTQNAIPQNAYLEALEETNRLADMVESYELDYSNKYPRLYKDAEAEFKQRIANGVVERGLNKLSNYKTEYLPRIKEELETYKKNDAIDFMLLDADYKNWLRENNMHYGLSRGSVSGSLIAYLLHNTDIDSVKYKLNFSRFMNPERKSLADVDTDIYAEDRYKVREYLFEREGLYCCNIITFNTIQLKAAIKDVGRAFGMSPEQTQAISDMVYTDDNGKDTIPDEVRYQYDEMFKYVDMVIGTITSLGRHAAGIVCSPTDIRYDFGTLSITSDPRPVSQIDMHEIDSLNFVKLDLLGLNAVGLIDGACKLAGIDYLTLDNTNVIDENVIRSIAEDTTLIFQFESGFASDSLKQTLSKSTIDKIKAQNKDISYLDIMAMVSGAIRPAGESYRNELFNGIYKDNGNEALNEFLKPTLGYLVYQEQIIDFLHEFCGYTMGQADIVRRHFAKKTGTETDIPIIENGGYMVDIHGNKDPRYIKGFVTIAQEKYGMTEDQAREAIKSFLVVIEDASNYLFSRNHSVPYSAIGLFIGWLRYYHKLELFTSALNVYKDNSEKMSSIKSYIKGQGIEIKSIKFGKSKAEYFMDKDENAIYQGLESIKYCNAQIAEELYELSKNKYDNIVQLFADINKKTSVNNRQLIILIGLDFFSDFGKNQYLLDMQRLYFGEKGKTKVIFPALSTVKNVKKDQLEKYGLSDYLMKKYANETEKMYKVTDNMGLLQEMASNVENRAMSIIDQIKFEQQYLEFVVYKNPKVHESYYIVTDYSVGKNAALPRLTLHNVRTGEDVKTRIKKSTVYKSNPFGLYSVLKIDEFTEAFKTKKIGDEWCVTEEIELVLENYEVIK